MHALGHCQCRGQSSLSPACRQPATTLLPPCRCSVPPPHLLGLGEGVVGLHSNGQHVLVAVDEGVGHRGDGGVVELQAGGGHVAQARGDQVAEVLISDVQHLGADEQHRRRRRVRKELPGAAAEAVVLCPAAAAAAAAPLQAGNRSEVGREGTCIMCARCRTLGSYRLPES